MASAVTFIPNTTLVDYDIVEEAKKRAKNWKICCSDGI